MEVVDAVKQSNVKANFETATSDAFREEYQPVYPETKVRIIEDGRDNKIMPTPNTIPSMTSNLTSTKSSTRKFALFAFSILIFCIIGCERPYFFEIKVIDEQGIPIENADVTIGKGNFNNGKTNILGRFNYSCDLPDGLTFDLIVSADGYETIHQNLKPGKALRSKYEINLKKSDL